MFIRSGFGSLRRLRLATHAGDDLVNGGALLGREAPDVDDVGGLERPDEGLDPRHRDQQPGPPHDPHRFRVGVLAGDRDAARQPGQPDAFIRQTATGELRMPAVADSGEDVVVVTNPANPFLLRGMPV
jgi:hypothetical protein